LLARSLIVVSAPALRRCGCRSACIRRGQIGRRRVRCLILCRNCRSAAGRLVLTPRASGRAEYYRRRKHKH
jgi:hypothetical protein